MFESLFNSSNKERILLYLAAREEGYAREIARFFGSSLAPIQNQLDLLERGGIIFSRTLGRTRLYAFDPRYPLLPELKALLDKTLTFYPSEERDRLLLERQRPRRKGKPL
jgi:hypothetical protein